MLIALSKMLVVGHKFGVPGKFKSIPIMVLPNAVTLLAKNWSLSGLKVVSLQKVHVHVWTCSIGTMAVSIN